MTSISDLIDFDSLLTPEERQLRDSVRSFVEAEFKPNIAKWYESATFPLEICPSWNNQGGGNLNLRLFVGRGALLEAGLSRSTSPLWG